MLFYKFFFYFIKFWSINCFISAVYPLILLNLFLLKLHMCVCVCVCVCVFIYMYISSVTFEFMFRVILILLRIRRKNMSLMITLLKTGVYLLSHFLFSLHEIIFGEKNMSILTFNCF